MNEQEWFFRFQTFSMFTHLWLRFRSRKELDICKAFSWLSNWWGEYELTDRRAGGMFIRIFHSFPWISISVHSWHLMLEERPQDYSGSAHPANTFSAFKAYDGFSQLKQFVSSLLFPDYTQLFSSLLQRAVLRKHYFACNLCTTKCGACGIGLVTWLAAPLILATRETSPVLSSDWSSGHQFLSLIGPEIWHPCKKIKHG